jgi:hypothetical protein
MAIPEASAEVSLAFNKTWKNPFALLRVLCGLIFKVFFWFGFWDLE